MRQKPVYETPMQNSQRVHRAKTEQAETWLKTLNPDQYVGLVNLLLRGEDCHFHVLYGILKKRHGDETCTKYKKLKRS